jgi:hypothetical protein
MPLSGIVQVGGLMMRPLSIQDGWGANRGLHCGGKRTGGSLKGFFSRRSQLPMVGDVEKKENQ